MGSDARFEPGERGAPDVAVAFAVMEVGETEDEGCREEDCEGMKGEL